MFWEFIATVFAGVGAAGVLLIVRSVTRLKTPSWSIPAVAGSAMLAFQIYSEYNWFPHQKSLLPNDVTVVRHIEEAAPWRPWSYLYPQTVRFIAVRVGKAAVNTINPDLVLAEVYLFERRMSARRIHQVFHCEQNARADFSESLEIPPPGASLDNTWIPLAADDQMLRAVCGKALAGSWQESD
jgi:hypothetical protein